MCRRGGEPFTIIVSTRVPTASDTLIVVVSVIRTGTSFETAVLKPFAATSIWYSPGGSKRKEYSCCFVDGLDFCSRNHAARSVFDYTCDPPRRLACCAFRHANKQHASSDDPEEMLRSHRGSRRHLTGVCTLLDESNREAYMCARKYSHCFFCSVMKLKNCGFFLRLSRFESCSNSG